MPRLATYILLLALVTSAGCGGEDVSSTPKTSARPESHVVFRSQDGRELTIGDLSKASGKFEYQIMDTNDIPDKANALHQKGRQLGAAGEYKQAVELFAQAHDLAPDWPYPTYDMAYTYLLMEDFAKAREHYDKTVKMSPRGFFTAITALDTLDREANGDLPEGTYAAYIAFEWMEDPDQKAKAVASMVERLPRFAPAWMAYALQCKNPIEKLNAIEKGLAAGPDAETQGMLLLNKATTLDQQGDTKAAIEILGNLAMDPNTTFANEHLAKQTLAMITQ